jgi:hypothetical protein
LSVLVSILLIPASWEARITEWATSARLWENYEELFMIQRGP